MYRNLVFVIFFALTATCFLCATEQAFAQECPVESSDEPSAPSKVRTLEGQLIFHNDIRGWFELKLDREECGDASIQALQFKDADVDLERFRGCRVKSTGAIDYSPTGYYSARLFQDVEKLEPVGACALKRPFPNYADAVPDKSVHAYTVDMHLDYSPGDHPIEFHVRSRGRELRPWQAYASYTLTGGYVLYGKCAKGFVVDKVYGTPSARPGHFDDPRTPEDMAQFDPEGAAEAATRDLRLGYTCIRQPRAKH